MNLQGPNYRPLFPSTIVLSVAGNHVVSFLSLPPPLQIEVIFLPSSVVVLLQHHCNSKVLIEPILFLHFIAAHYLVGVVSAQESLDLSYIYPYNVDS